MGPSGASRVRLALENARGESERTPRASAGKEHAPGASMPSPALPSLFHERMGT